MMKMYITFKCLFFLFLLFKIHFTYLNLDCMLRESLVFRHHTHTHTYTPIRCLVSFRHEMWIIRYQTTKKIFFCLHFFIYFFLLFRIPKRTTPATRNFFFVHHENFKQMKIESFFVLS